MPALARPHAVSALSPLVLCGLVACGGGGAAAPTVKAQSVVANGGTTLIAAADGTPSTTAAVAGAALAPVGLTGLVSDSGTALGSDGRVVLVGLPAAPVRLDPWPDAAGARRWYVDSRIGNDAADGRSPDRAWRTLARLATATLQPGDRVVLACGSVWHETLRLPASGSANRPLVVGSPPEGCDTPPAIDGSVDLSAAAWVRHDGNVWRTTLATPPLQLFSASVDWVEAHHPNRSASGPTWLPLSADANVVSVNGRNVSTRLPLGAELQLPAGAALGAGTRVRVRSAAYIVDDLPAALNGRTLELAAPTTEPVTAGWGYLLTGQPWMVDSSGEWLHDAATSRLLVWDGGSAAQPQRPTAATVLGLGLDLQGRSDVVVDGLDLRRLGTGAWVRDGRRLRLRNLRLSDLADRGVDAAASTDVVLEASLIERSGADAVFGGGMAAVAAQGFVVQGNVIRDSGVRRSGNVALSLPRRSYGAILAGATATVADNVVDGAAYIGVRVFERSRASGNVVHDSCLVLDDCGALYTWGAGNDSVFEGNLVVGVRGNAAGKPAWARVPQAQGLYLDDDASGVQVQGNTVVDADHGLQLHDARGNTISGNRFYGNRVAQAWLQDTRRLSDGGSAVRDNRFLANQLVPVHTGARGLLASTLQPTAAAFGLADGNRWFDSAADPVAAVATAQFARTLSMPDWWTLPDLVQPGLADGSGSATSGDGFASWRVSAGNRIANGDLSSGSAGFAPWSAAAPAPQLTLASCAGRRCLRWVAGGGAGLLSSANFSVEQGRWYRLTIDLAADADDVSVPLVVRRGGGGSNGYESLADRDLTVVAGRSLRRVVRVFQATRTVRARDPATGDLGARVDIEASDTLRALTLARIELVPVAAAPVARVSAALVNAGSSAVALTCPLPAAQAAWCHQLVDVADIDGARQGRRVGWPLTLAPRSALLLRGLEPAWVDRDGDGIADDQDLCPGTAAREVVDASGCARSQR